MRMATPKDSRSLPFAEEVGARLHFYSLISRPGFFTTSR